MYIKSMTYATAIALCASSVAAGGLSPEINEPPVTEVAPPPATSSVSPALIVVGILAALLIASSMDGGDDDEAADPDPTPSTECEKFCDE